VVLHKQPAPKPAAGHNVDSMLAPVNCAGLEAGSKSKALDLRQRSRPVARIHNLPDKLKVSQALRQPGHLHHRFHHPVNKN
jgi:hypothetical protein